jgi:hypothetical protein
VPGHEIEVGEEVTLWQPDDGGHPSHDYRCTIRQGRCNRFR